MTTPDPAHAHAVLHCNLNTYALATSEAFYTERFDLVSRMRQVSPDEDSRFMGLGAHSSSSTVFLYDERGPRAAPALELVKWFEPDGAARVLDGQRGLTALGLRTPELPEGWRESLRVRGREQEVAVLTDPDGVRVEVVAVRPPQDQPQTAALAYERIRCSDLAASLDWYAGIGWAVIAQGEGWASIALPEDPTFTIELDQGQGAPHGMDAATQGIYRMALASEDVRAAHTALVEAGMSGLQEPHWCPMSDVPTGGFAVLFLSDPDGVVMELVDRPRSSVRRPSEPV